MAETKEMRYLVDISELPVSNRAAWLKLLSICSTKEILKLLAEAWDYLHQEGYEVVVEQV